MSTIFRELKKMHMAIRTIVTLLLVVTIGLMSTRKISAAKHKTDWFQAARWGVMTHYLVDNNVSAQEWNDRVRKFDVSGLAKQLKSVGAGYYMITIGQNSGHYCAPNTKYDRHTGIVPSKCSTRDLVSDLYNALNPLGIKLMVYLPAGAPAQDSVAVNKLAWTNGAVRNQQFQVKWESIIREWSLRWGKKVSGWWFDGVYWPKEMYEHSQAPNFRSFAAAAKAGNPDSIIAFNSAIKYQYPLVNVSSYEDYTAGEMNEPLGVECESRWVGKSQLHILSYLGTNWGSGVNRYSNQQVVKITNSLNKCGGVVTWDVPIKANGQIVQSFVNQLMALKNAPKISQFTAPAAIPPGNLASNKKAIFLDASGEKILPVNSAKYFPRFGVDGDPNTFALAGEEWSWIYQVDLANNYLINRISITFGPKFATEYQVLSSNNGKDWSKLKYERNARGGKYNYKFPRTKMRYIRIYGIKPDAPNQLGEQMSIAELEAYQ
jgi:F5/8 type C domain